MTFFLNAPVNHGASVRDLVTRTWVRWFPSRKALQRQTVETAYDAARKAYRDACDRGDTRDMKRHWPEFFRTQTERLKLEVGR